MLLQNFLRNNQVEILALTEAKTVELAGNRSSSEELREGLPKFFQQLLGILMMARPATLTPAGDKPRASKAVDGANEVSLATANGRPEEAKLAAAAGRHGVEMLRLGYSLSQVVHAYGAMCQAITELATNKRVSILADGFHDLNRCLDVAIAGAVEGYQELRDSQSKSREDTHLGVLAHEMRNALSTATLSLRLVKKGTVGMGGSTAQVLERSLERLEELIDRSLTEVRLRVDPEISIESHYLLHIIDQILVTARSQALEKNQTLRVSIEPGLVIEADQHAFHAAISNLIQNSLKFTPAGGSVEVRGKLSGDQIVVEVEDECGGLQPSVEASLFQAFKQHHENREGLGLGLTIARRAIELNQGTLEARNLPGKGCVFTITLPAVARASDLAKHK